MKPLILLVEDDPDMRQTTKVLLTRAGYRVLDVDAAEEALSLAFQDIPDLLVADIRLPGISGIKLCEILRGDPRTRALPVLFLTSLLKTQDKVQGFKTGADDYVTKPFEPSEFLARVEALLRRAGSVPVPSVLLRWKGLTVDLESRRAEVDGAPVPLRRKEFDLLALFLKNPGKLLTRDRLSQALWDDGTVVSDNTLYVHVNTLRERLGSYGKFIHTRINEGYSLEDTPL
jgi:two-component system alkaline phosphatase synthesis response regulator PhoP